MSEINIWAGLHDAVKRVEADRADLSEAYEWRDQQIVGIYKNGVSIAEISRRIGLNHSTIHKILKQQNAK